MYTHASIGYWSYLKGNLWHTKSTGEIYEAWVGILLVKISDLCKMYPNLNIKLESFWLGLFLSLSLKIPGNAVF